MAFSTQEGAPPFPAPAMPITAAATPPPWAEQCQPRCTDGETEGGDVVCPRPPSCSAVDLGLEARALWFQLLNYNASLWGILSG